MKDQTKELLDNIITIEQRLVAQLLVTQPEEVTIMEVIHPVPTPEYIMGRDDGRVEIVIRAVIGRKPNKKDRDDIENKDWIKEY